MKTISKILSFLFFGVIGGLICYQAGQSFLSYSKEQGAIITSSSLLEYDILFPVIGFIAGGYIGRLINYLSGNETN